MHHINKETYTEIVHKHYSDVHRTDQKKEYRKVGDENELKQRTHYWMLNV